MKLSSAMEGKEDTGLKLPDFHPTMEISSRVDKGQELGMQCPLSDLIECEFAMVSQERVWSS